jgi:hypothetical protein
VIQKLATGFVDIFIFAVGCIEHVLAHAPAPLANERFYALLQASAVPTTASAANELFF